MEKGDYKNRSYLSAVEAARYLNLTVSEVHLAVKKGLPVERASSGQMRFVLGELKNYREKLGIVLQKEKKIPDKTEIKRNGTVQKIFLGDSRCMEKVADNSIHLVVTSPPYFDAKMYSPNPCKGDLGDIHDLDEWLEEIGQVWGEVLRVLQPGRKVFINIVNYPRL